MRMVSKTEFYKIIYNRRLDVHPRPLGRYVDGEGFTTHWKFPSGELFGVSLGNSFQVAPQWIQTGGSNE